MEIKSASSPNYRVGRKGRSIIAIVNHITAGLMPGTLSWLQNLKAQASAHYLVTKSGTIYQMVKDEDTAWHAGIVNNPDWPLYDGSNPNYYTLGIEHEALAGDYLTEEQYQATLWLHRQLVQKWGININPDHIIGHYRIDSVNRKNDPGPGFPWTRLFKDLKESVVIKPVEVDVLMVSKIFKGIIEDNQAYAPVRDLAEGLGRQVNWDGTLNAVLIPPVTIEVPPGTAGTVRIATGSTIIDGRLIENKGYVPVRKLVEALGHKVVWDETNKTITIQ